MKTDIYHDWKEINRYRRKLREKIAEQKVPAPSLISADKELLRLRRELNNSEYADIVIY